MLMLGKQFKILNRKFNSLLQSQADTGGKHSVFGIEVDVMLKDQELHLQHKLDVMDKNNELRVMAQSETLNGKLVELKAVAKERHVLFVQDLKTVREDVNRKLEELKVDMAKEIHELSTNYSSLLSKVDIVAGAVTKIVECYQTLVPKIEDKVVGDATSFGNLDVMLGELKELVLKSGSSSLLTPKILTQKFR